MLNETAVELTKKKGITLVQAFVELKKQGWQLESYELGEEVQEALIAAGLMAAPVEDIIKQMQEDSK